MRKEMQIDLFSGVWVFDATRSTLTSPPPISWVQHVSSANGRFRIREEIERPSGTTVVEVEAYGDGAFYPVRGSAVADEISYLITGSVITGVARKVGTVSLRETIDFSVPDVMMMNLVLVISEKEVPLGMAYFLKHT